MPVFSRLAVAVQLFTVFLTPVLGVPTQNQFDYVIVGGGVTGLVVANRLSEDKSKTVLVIEAGEEINTDATKIPYKSNDISSAAGMYWEGMKSLGEPALGNASFPVIAAKVLGGGSLINGMIYDRGSAADYDTWEALGNKGWGWSGMKPYFIKGTTFQPPSAEVAKDFNITWDPSVYGNGPLKVSITNNQYQDIKSYWAAWRESGVFVPLDANNGQAYGPSWLGNTMDVDTGYRCHARNAYLDTVRKTRTNLHIITGTTVKRINFDTKKSLPVATGVEVTDKTGRCTTFNARMEVVLAAGAIATPKLLQLSGIGPKSVLKAAGIRTLVEMDAVGSNLQDHPYATVIYNTTNVHFPNQYSLTTDANFNASAWEEYKDKKTGPYTYARGNALAFIPLPEMTNDTASIINTLNSQTATDYLPPMYKTNKKLARGFEKQRKITANLFSRRDVAAAEFPLPADGTYVIVGVEKPLSRGYVHINPKNPNGVPDIMYNAFVNPIDRMIMSIGLRFFRKVWASKELASHKVVERVPGAQYTTDEELWKALLAQSMLSPSLVHQAGTCAMMPREDGGCVDDKLMVYGTQHLSVVDASIIPILPSCHLQATMYGIGEKAADIIKARS